MLTRLLVSRLLLNIAYMKIWVHLTFVLVHLRKNVRRTSAPLVQKVSLEPCYYYISLRKSIIKRKAQYSAVQCTSRVQNDGLETTLSHSTQAAQPSESA